MRLVAKRQLTAAERETLTGRVRQRFHHPFRIAFAYVDEIPRCPEARAGVIGRLAPGSNER